MKITKIERQKNNLKRYSIFIDYDFAFGIDEEDLIYYKLSEGKNIDESFYNNILENTVFKNAKDKALKYLGYKMRTEKQVKIKLYSYDFSESIVNQVINLLKEYNYINDEEYAKSFIKNKMNLTGYGSLKIRYELKMQGIQQEIFEKYLQEESELSEEKKVIELINKRVKNLVEIDYKEKQKIYAYLARRGFSYNIINIALKNFLEDFYG